MAGLKGSVIVTTLMVLTFIDPVTPDGEEGAFIVETKDVHESIFIQAALKARYSDVQHCDGFRMGVHLDNVRKLFPLDLHVCPFATMNVTRHGDGGKDSPYTMEVYADTLIGRLNAVGDMDTIGTSLKEVSIPLGKQFTISCTLQDMNVTVTDNGGSHSFLIRHSTRMELKKDADGLLKNHSHVTFFMDSTQQ
uniref:Uncharacterized protein n=1 Tax=Branchiostoma floridae TaxID=7739 RepID=C3Y3P5_BRAFL|eukprot:XP_002608911.1 hypothetical protein BRAFLDRAFT_85524 [Branchiostoma floridae]